MMFDYLDWIAAPLIFALVARMYWLALTFFVRGARLRLFDDLRFSTHKFVLLMGWVPAAFIAVSLLLDPTYLLFFALAGVAGVVGETLLSLAWRQVFTVPIWTYSYRNVVGGATSLLNLLPWAVGGFLFVSLARPLRTVDSIGLLATYPKHFVFSLALVGGGLLAALLLLMERSRSANPGEFTLGRFAVFCVPVVTALTALVLFGDARYLFLFPLFAVVGCVTEYLYGLFISQFFVHNLWSYHHLPLDGGQSSLTNIPLWALGGVYFCLIGEWVGLV